MAFYRNGSLSYVGRVLWVESREERVMSDVWAYVTYTGLVEDDGSVRKQLVKCHFELDGGDGHAVADATPEVLELVRAYDKRCSAERAIQDAEKRLAKLSKPLKPVVPLMPRIAVGDMAMVVGAVPGLAKGDMVNIVWTGRSQFSDAERVGLLVDGKKVYTAAAKVSRVCTVEELEKADQVAEIVTKHSEIKRQDCLLEVARELEEAKKTYAAAILAHGVEVERCLKVAKVA